MFGTLGGPELFLIFVVALIVFGPRKLPDIGKSLGRMMSEFRRASNDFKSTIESEVESEKIKESMRIEPPRVKPVKATPPATPAAGVAAADGMDPSPEADEPGGAGDPSDAHPRAPGTRRSATEPKAPLTLPRRRRLRDAPAPRSPFPRPSAAASGPRRRVEVAAPTP